MSCFESWYVFACELIWPCLCPQTLCALFRGVHQKNKSASGFDIINMLVGFDKAEQRMKVRPRLPLEERRARGDWISQTLLIYVHAFLCRTWWRDWTASSVARAPRVWRVSASNCCCVWWRWGLACVILCPRRKILLSLLQPGYSLTRKCFYRWPTTLVKIPSWSTSWSTAFLKPFYRWLLFIALLCVIFKRYFFLCWFSFSFYRITFIWLFFLINPCVFFSLLQILSDASSRGQHGYDAVVLLALLVNYRKYEVCKYKQQWKSMSCIPECFLENFTLGEKFCNTHSHAHAGVCRLDPNLSKSCHFLEGWGWL